MSHAACSRESRSLEILISAVVTIVVSKADKKRQSHSPAITICNRFELMFGTTGAREVARAFSDLLLLSSTMMLSRLKTAVRSPPHYKLQAQLRRGHLYEGQSDEPKHDANVCLSAEHERPILPQKNVYHHWCSLDIRQVRARIFWSH